MNDSSKQLNTQNTQDTQLDVIFQDLEDLEYDNRNISSNNIEKNSYQEKTENFNQNIIRKGLLPELKQNEQQKRELKPKLMTNIVRLIFVHSVFMLVLLVLLVCAVTLNVVWFKGIDIDILKELSDFMKFFITASLVEFIGMLLVIVHYIFDKTIDKLIKEFNSKNDSQTDDENNRNINIPKSIEDKSLNIKKLTQTPNGYENDDFEAIDDLNDGENNNEEDVV